MMEHFVGLVAEFGVGLEVRPHTRLLAPVDQRLVDFGGIRHTNREEPTRLQPILSVRRESVDEIPRESPEPLSHHVS